MPSINMRLAAAGIGLLALIGLVLSSLFAVGEDELVLRSRFGRVLQSDYAPGLHVCWPFERIVRFDRRVLTTRLQGESFLTSEQQGLMVDIDLSWRIRDAELFLRAGSADEQVVAARLGDAVRSELKAWYAHQPAAQIIAAPRGGLSDASRAQLQAVAAALGIELVDERVRRIDPTDEVANAIYARMQAAYAAQARQLRAEAAAEAGRIRAEADRDRAEILASANRDAQRVRGEADAEAAAVYARAYGGSPEFAAFYRTLQAYRSALVRDGDILVIQPEGEFYKYLRNPARH